MSGPHLDAEVIVAGAGFGGIGLGVKLREHGYTSFIILEKSSEVGGTWRDNVYPGCACDVPAMLYSFSFGPHADWTRLYPPQQEILHYLKRTSQECGIDPHIRFNSELDDARYDEASNTWAVRIKDGSVLHCRLLVCALGPLSKPKIPDIPGRERFAGPAFHSSQWDHRVDLRGKNVAVLGTGASAVQFIPQIAPAVKRLTIFQRSAPWVIPRGDRAVSPPEQTRRRHLPGYAWFVRQSIYWTLEARALGFVVNPSLLRRQEKTILRFIERSVPDPELRVKVTPHYRAGCKRVLVSDDYYPALARPNVRLVTSAAAEIRPGGVAGADGTEHPADVIVFGTGFNATEGLAPVRIYGRGGAELGEAWRDGMRAYLGTSVAGFPNLFLVIGPNTGLGHNSMVLMMEAQYRYLLGALDYMRKTKVRELEVSANIQAQFNAWIQQRLKGTVWATGCSSWYIDARGMNTTLWPGFTFAYARRTARFDAAAYRDYGS